MRCAGRGLWSPQWGLFPQQKGCSSGPMLPPCYHHHCPNRIQDIPKLPGEGIPEDQWGCSSHLSPAPYLVERKPLHHHPLVGVLTDGKGPLGLQEVVDLLIVHLRRKEARERPEGEAGREASPLGAGES